MALELSMNYLRILLSSAPLKGFQLEKLTNTKEIDINALYFILMHSTDIP